MATQEESLDVDFGERTGRVLGGATGMLYGLGDEGVPSRALIAGARPRSVAQKAPNGDQHPGGDSVAVAPSFFDSGGGEVLVYMQDSYSRWPYEQLGMADYLERISAMVNVVAGRHDHDRFSWVPFNEPDWIWYGNWEADRERFFADWAAAVRAIRRVLPAARIVGPNEMNYNRERLEDFLRWAQHEDLLPDVMSWHELTPEARAGYRGHHADYRELERLLGIAPLPINIDEYGNRRDMSNPGQMIHWLSMLEDTKVDADMAYWTLAGNLDDHAVQTNQPNGGWWLLKWYADLTGETASTSAGGASDAVPGIATIDETRSQATVLVGGTGSDIAVELRGLPQSIFGGVVDVTVTGVSWTGYEGSAPSPRTLARHRVALDDDRLRITVDNDDPMACYQLVITPVEQEFAAPRAPWTARYEAEDAVLVAASVEVQDDDPQKHATSAGRDVRGMTGEDSSITFHVSTPAAGRYLAGIFYGTPACVAQQAIYLDDRFHGVVDYPATLSYGHRGRVDVPLDLTAGDHRISIRTSGPDGHLAASDVSIDRLDLTPATGAETSGYPARAARLTGGARIIPGSEDRPAGLELAELAVATFFVATADDGYYEFEIHGLAPEGSALEVSLNDRTLPPVHFDDDGAARYVVHFAAGVSVVALRTTGTSVVIHGLRLTRARDSDTATTLVAIGTETAGTIPLERTDVTGAVNLTVRYANGAKNTAHEYNTDVITAFADLTEDGGDAVTVGFRHSYAWDSFWSIVVPVDLRTTDGGLSLRYRSETAPRIESVSISPLVLARVLK